MKNPESAKSSPAPAPSGPAPAPDRPRSAAIGRGTNGVKVGVVAAVIDLSGRVLCIRRSATVPAPLKVCLPGGTVEPNESLEAAVVRELREEVGLKIEPTEQFWDWTHESGKLRLFGFLARTDDPRPDPLEAEVAEVMWLSPEAAAAHPDAMPSMTDCMRKLRERLGGGR
jgi:8-oxo-dGTP diphosphatase